MKYVAISKATVLHDHQPVRRLVKYRPATRTEKRTLHPCRCRIKNKI